jgi:hypothetical protein
MLIIIIRSSKIVLQRPTKGKYSKSFLQFSYDHSYIRDVWS